MSVSTGLVRCRNVWGAVLEVELTDRGEFVTPGSVLEQRLVVAANEQVFVRKWVSRAAGEREPRRYDLLDNEIRAGTRLGQVYGDRYPRELARLAAYNMDVEEPFVLLHEYRGEPAAKVIDRLDDGQRRQFQVSLLHALQATAAAGVLHGAVRLDAVRCDGSSVQLVDFDSARRAGEPRPGGNGSTAGVSDVREDLWGGAQLIRRVALSGVVDGSPTDRATDPERLRTLLDPVFDEPPERRPYPATLLRVLRADNQVPPPADPEDGLAPGREQFDRVHAAKRQLVRPQPAAERPARPGRWFARLLPLFVLMAVVMAAGPEVPR